MTPMPDTEHIEAPDFLGGDHCIRYRGPDVPAHAIKAGDVLAIADRTDPNVGQLVIAKNVEGEAMLALYEAGMDVLGVLTGVMRRLDA